MRVVVVAHGSPGLPRDPQDYQTDQEADDRIGDRQAGCNDERRGDHCQADIGVGARVFAVCAQRSTVQAPPSTHANLRGDEVSAIADRARDTQGEEMRRRTRMNEPLHRLNARHARADEDRSNDSQARTTLGPIRTKRESDPERDRGQRVAEVVDQIGEQRNAATRDKHDGLRERGQAENREREQDRADAVPRALDAPIDEAV